MNFDPIKYMNSADAANTQIMDENQEQKFKEFTEGVLAEMNSRASVPFGAVRRNQVALKNDEFLNTFRVDRITKLKPLNLSKQ